MEQDFYKGRLAEKYDLTVLTPDDADRNIVHNIFYNELCLGNFNLASKVKYLRIIESLAAQGAETRLLFMRSKRLNGQ